MGLLLTHGVRVLFFLWQFSRLWQSRVWHPLLSPHYLPLLYFIFYIPSRIKADGVCTVPGYFYRPPFLSRPFINHLPSLVYSWSSALHTLGPKRKKAMILRRGFFFFLLEIQARGHWKLFKLKIATSAKSSPGRKYYRFFYSLFRINSFVSVRVRVFVIRSDK